ncbi:MAG: patatin [Chloroflexi bacterium]|nr:MAG: patatin [Chloroflexota bacterium]
MLNRTRDEHLFGPGPKRILALDGGGIRGALTLGYLARIEDILRRRAGGDPNFRLCDYFDLIAGTSTGSIIAAGLALGFSVEELQTLYRSLAAEVFKKPPWRLGLLSAKFPREPLENALRHYFDDITLGSDKLRTGLLIVAKRLDTGSPWIIHNNPRGKYFNPSPGGGVPNKDYLLREVVRASTAAPHYFEPEDLQVAQGVSGAFVDGGVSPYNNPSLPAMMLATLEGFGLQWAVGEDRLLLASVGTGSHPTRMDPRQVMEMTAARLAAQSILSIMADCDQLTQTLLQWMSNSPTAWVIDSEIGDLRNDLLGRGPALLHYLRYNVLFDPAWLRQTLGVEMDEESASRLYAMDNPDNVTALSELGATAARVQILEDHFPPVFDLTA